jgi:hypothetical protein
VQAALKHAADPFCPLNGRRHLREVLLRAVEAHLQRLVVRGFLGGPRRVVQSRDAARIEQGTFDDVMAYPAAFLLLSLMITSPRA